RDLEAWIGRNRRNGQRKEGVPRSPCTAAGCPDVDCSEFSMTTSPPRPAQPAQHAPPRRRDAVRADLLASLVVFLVAVPLSLGIALASGAPLMAGLIAAVVGGVVAGLLGGSPLQVSGPAAGLTVVVAELVTRFGWQTTCLITAGAGVLQIAFGCAR